MTVTATVKASISLTNTGSNDMGNPVHQFIESVSIAIANGTGADQANNAWSDERTINASSTDELDLAGVLADVFGATLTMAAVKAIMIEADAANTNNVVVGGAAANTFTGPFSDATDKIVLGPGDVFLVTRRSATGMAVTGGTGDKFLIANSGAGTAVVYRITLLIEA